MNIIITGAARGIGFEAAKQLAGDPAHKIFAVSRSREGLEELAKACLEVNPGHQLQTLSFDVEKGDYDKELIPGMLKIFTKVDILVNNAGRLVNKPFRELTSDDYELMFGANVKGPFRIIQSLLPYFNNPAHILNIGSMGGFQGSAKFTGLSLYSASKGALAILTECLAEEFKDYGISVNCLALGSAQTQMFGQAFPGYKSPLTASDMASFVAGFALTGNRYFNGKVLPVALSTP
jgi:NAD(P)-dependent dehydrogenase (short-subunit alcohol dehydrogenase family)